MFKVQKSLKENFAISFVAFDLIGDLFDENFH